MTKAGHHRDQAGENRRQRPPTGKAVRHHRLDPVAGLVVLRPSALLRFQRDQEQRRQHQAEGELRSRRPVAHREPCLVDARRKGLHAEMRHRAEIGDGFHQRQDRAAGDRRPRHRQADPEKRAPRPVPHRARGEIGCRRLAQEGRARQQVDIRVENEDQHQRRTGQRADFREPVVARPPAGHRPQRRLHRARMIEQVGIGIGQHIGRKGERQRQHDLEDAAARKAAHRHQPGGTRSRRRRADGDQHRKLHRVPDITRHHRVPQPEPGLERAARRRNADGGDRDDAKPRTDPGEALQGKMKHGWRLARSRSSMIKWSMANRF
jgi:hypothetical protein